MTDGKVFPCTCVVSVKLLEPATAFRTVLRSKLQVVVTPDAGSEQEPMLVPLCSMRNVSPRLALLWMETSKVPE